MFDKGVIQHSSSPWASPVVLACKKDGSVRFCIDCRKLSEQEGCLPIPRVEDTLDTLAGLHWVSTLDLISGYWQVEMRPEDRQDKTSFYTPERFFEFKVMHFGLCNAAITFRRLMDAVLMDLYEYLYNLKCVFERLASS